MTLSEMCKKIQDLAHEYQQALSDEDRSFSVRDAEIVAISDILVELENRIKSLEERQLQ